ncbi:MAG: Lrp/AsnC family transcriptional regulator [Candidatus Thorarchaeota archaeon]|nr:Lrp/AsnC family transcriptional regulator [Candidatus Thorarchaeota archaeon]
MRTSSLDSTDKKILWELVGNCRISYRDLGKKVSLSASSVKKRIDNLENSGLIDHYIVALNPEFTNVWIATLMIFTDASVKISTFKDVVMRIEGVYMVLPLINGDFYLSVEYAEQSVLEELVELIRSIEGVERVEVYDVFPIDEKSELPEAPQFTRNELDVLSQLAINPRMVDHEIANRIQLPTKKVKQILQNLETEHKIALTLRWNPSLGRNIPFNLVIKYDSDLATAQEITSKLSALYPTSYFNSRIVESKSTIFAVFALEKVVDMEPIAMNVLGFDEVLSCFAITYYNAIVGKTLSRVKLERILEKEGLWPPKEMM